MILGSSRSYPILG
ncbi:hypothetical protein LINPERPRIM_LOCUS30747 [Linum perenne]